MWRITRRSPPAVEKSIRNKKTEDKNRTSLRLDVVKGWYGLSIALIS